MFWNPTGHAHFHPVVATDAAGRYAASIQPVVSVIVYASFLGSPSYTPSTSAKVRVIVTERSTRSTTTSSSTYSSSSPDYVLVPPESVNLNEAPLGRNY